MLRSREQTRPSPITRLTPIRSITSSEATESLDNLVSNCNPAASSALDLYAAQCIAT